MDRHLSDLAVTLFDCSAFQDYRQSKDGLGFKLQIHKTKPETPLSPFYISLRTPDHPDPKKRGPITPPIMEAIGQALYRRAFAGKLRYDAFVGLPDAGTPIAKAFDNAQPNLPRKELLGLRKRYWPKDEKKDQEAKPLFEHSLEGAQTMKDRVLLIDDVVSYGGTKGEAAGMLRKVFRLVVEDCLVLIDRRPHRLRGESIAGLKMHAAFVVEDLITCLYHAGKIPQDVVIRIMNYLETA